MKKNSINKRALKERKYQITRLESVLFYKIIFQTLRILHNQFKQLIIT